MMSHQELMNQVDMLKGNINRICVSDDIEEIESMYKFALMRLEKIHDDVLEKLMIKNDIRLKNKRK